MLLGQWSAFFLDFAGLARSKTPRPDKTFWMADIRLLAGYECLQPRLIEIVKIKIQSTDIRSLTLSLSMH